MRRFHRSAATASTAALLSAAALVSAPGLAPACADGPITHVEWKTFYGESFGGEFGIAVSAAGDVNNDGHPDLIVGARERTAFDPLFGSLPGYARVFSGLDGAVLHTVRGDPLASSGRERFGDAVSGAGDVNQDGYDDFLVGAGVGGPDRAGYVRVFSGLDASTLFTFEGEDSFEFFGASASGAGDVNNDAYPDFIAGAFWHDGGGENSGGIRVHSGLDGSVLYDIDGDAPGEALGLPVSGAGDVNQDGYDDFLAVAIGLGSDARVYSGLDGSTLYNVVPPVGSTVFSASDAGDVNNDGYADFIIGYRTDGEPGSDPSAAVVYSGLDGAILHEWSPPKATQTFGFGVSGAGDVNNDGYDDLIVGDSFGASYVYSGVSGALLYTFLEDQQGADFGRSVSNAGDLNGDGYDDFLVGAPFGGPDRTGFARVFLSTPTANLGDTNADRAIDLVDFDVLAQNFGAFTPAGAADADFNNDGVVDLLDFDLLARNYGLPAQAGASIPAVIPEPASAALLAVTGPLLLRGRGRRRRRRRR